MNAKSTQTTTDAAAAPANKHDDTLPIAAGGVLALLVVGSGAAAMMRRRRHEEVWTDDEQMYDEPAHEAAAEDASESRMIHEEQPAIVAPEASAFAWGNAENRAEAARTDEPMVENERNEGETWVERAYRGPSPSNPSVSLKTRLRRAAFFDKRERDAAAGLAEPLDPNAGLPDAMVREQEQERELA